MMGEETVLREKWFKVVLQDEEFLELFVLLGGFLGYLFSCFSSRY